MNTEIYALAEDRKNRILELLDEVEFYKSFAYGLLDECQSKLVRGDFGQMVFDSAEGDLSCLPE
jgi:hypothetical protein